MKAGFNYEELDNGEFLRDVNEKMEEIIEDVKQRPKITKKRSLTIKIEVDPSDDTMHLKQTATTKLPPDEFFAAEMLDEDEEEKPLLNLAKGGHGNE